MKLSHSQELFFDLYGKLSTKIEESTDTIFSDVSIAEHAEVNYERFMESKYSKQFFMENSTYQKNETIKAFIENEVLSELYTNTYDSLIRENSTSDLSFSQEIILEATVEQFNVKYKGSSNHELEQFEEGIGLGMAAASGIFAATGAIPSVPLVAFGALTVMGISLLMPARYARAADDASERLLGGLGKALFGTKSLLAMKGTSLGASNNNILNYDNIDVNPEVRKLFNSLSRTQNKKAPIDGINTIVASCVEKNGVMDDVELPSGFAGFIRGFYKAQYNSVFTVFIESLFKKATNKKDEEFNTLLRYRKCLAEKLVDMYKFLMIANISQSKDYRKIIRVMQKGFHNNPEQLLSFLHVSDESDQLNKENIITLTKYRMFLDDMVRDLKKGTFDIDREASIYLSQKLSTVDGEIEDYLSKNSKRIETVHENRNEFDRKDYKYNKPEEKNLKRKLMGFSDK